MQGRGCRCTWHHLVDCVVYQLTMFALAFCFLAQYVKLLAVVQPLKQVWLAFLSCSLPIGALSRTFGFWLLFRHRASSKRQHAQASRQSAVAGIRAIWPTGRFVPRPARSNASTGVALALLRESVQLLLTPEQVGPTCRAGPSGHLVAGTGSAALVLKCAVRLLSSAFTKSFRLVSNRRNTFQTQSRHLLATQALD